MARSYEHFCVFGRFGVAKNKANLFVLRSEFSVLRKRI
jgi:hypothetical protein